MADHDHRAVGAHNEFDGLPDAVGRRFYPPIHIPTVGSARGRVAGEVLDLIGQHQVRHPPSVDRVLHRQRCQLGVVRCAVRGRLPIRHVGERRLQIQVLEGATTELVRRHLTRDRQRGSSVDLGVVQPGEQVGGARSGDGETGGRPARQLAEGRSGERGSTLVADPHVGDVAAQFGLSECIGKPQIRVTHHPEHVGHTPGDEGLHHDIGGAAGFLGTRGQPNEHPVAPDLGGETRGRIGEPLGGFAGEWVVVVAVPGTTQPAVLDGTLTQGAALVRAAVVQRAVLVAAARERQRPAIDGDGAHPSVGQLIEVRNAVPVEVGFVHGSTPA